MSNDGLIIICAIAGFISLCLLVNFFSRLKEISDHTRETRNECESIKKILLNFMEMYAEQNGFIDAEDAQNTARNTGTRSGTVPNTNKKQ